MAERRMFARTMVTSDAFLDMSHRARCLYFYLGMIADDDGFINNARSAMRQTGTDHNDLDELAANKFIIAFDSGVVVIKHWKINNLIKNDRYKETVYLREKSMLLVDRKGAYFLVKDGNGSKMVPKGFQNGSKMEPQYSIGKSSIGEYRRESAHAHAREDEKSLPRYGVYGNVLLTDEEYGKLQEEFPGSFSEKIDNLSSYLKRTGKTYGSHYATILHWAKEDKEKADREEAERQAKRYGNFDVNEAFERAVERSFEKLKEDEKNGS